MQKFFKLKDEDQANLQPTQVKLAGYLKKKRTKVGGWRKLWFVLQNQLLLSYPSQDDYEKRLAPFKDVLNLVPGTVVRPLGAFRFAIQTTSESVYIFRCDDNNTYMEWITALVDCLSIGSSSMKKDGVTKKSLHASRSCSSLIRSKKHKSVHIPIAQGTAMILNRTGHSVNNLDTYSSAECSPRLSNDRTNYLCSSDNQLLQRRQSNAVFRINRMFYPSASDLELSSGIKVETSDTPQHKPDIIESSDAKMFSCDSDSEITQGVVINKKMHNFLNFIKTDTFKVVVDEVSDSDVWRDINFNNSLESKVATEVSQEATASKQDTTCSIGDTVIVEKSQSISTGAITERNNTSKICPLRLNKAARKEESLNAKLCDIIEYEKGGPHKIRAESSENPIISKYSKEEPIYAVVNLKHKYERRARRRHELEQRRKSLGDYLNLDEVTADYEEVLKLADETNDNQLISCDEENIYEPINLPTPSDPKHRNIIWKFFSGISFDTLIETTKTKKRTSKTQDNTTSPFANIRQKLSQHRKSIRIRMTRLYARDDTIEVTEPKPRLCLEEIVPQQEILNKTLNQPEDTQPIRPLEIV